MATTAEPKEESVSREQMLDESFVNMRRVAQGICQNLARPKDRDICRNTLDQLSEFNQATTLYVKEHVHNFMSFYLKCLRWTQKRQPLALYKQWYGCTCEANKSKSDGSLNSMRIWLKEGKCYMAMQTFENGSTIIYTAVSRDTDAGWKENGLKLLIQ